MLDIVLGCAVLGVASHLGYFIHGELHMASSRIFTVFTITPIILFILVSRHTGSYFDAGKYVGIATSSYFAALTLSICTYRAFFHPLRDFPGPFGLKLSKFTYVSWVARDFRSYSKLDQLHKQYGEFVRVGPNELTTTAPEAVNLILGSGSKCKKAVWYDCVGYPHKSLNLIRDRQVHDKRRKAWDKGFTAKALREYEPRVRKSTDQLMSQFAANSGKPMNASKWFNFYSFDMMGDMAFGKSFDIMKTGVMDPVIKLMQEGMSPLGVLTPIPWILPLLQNIPGLAAAPKAFIKSNTKRVAARKMSPPDSPDLFKYLIDAEKQSDDPIHKNPMWLIGDCGLVIVAGSDTTTATLTHIFYELARSPRVLSKLRKELNSFYKPGSENEFKSLQEATYLNGIINEALRLYPPVPGGLLRQTPPEGLTIGKTFIPGGVTISTPFWTMGRLESCYKDAEEFIPERWSENPDMVFDKSVFVPFSAGPFNCVGKHLALMELRNVTARIVNEFDVEFAPGEDGRRLLHESKDVFTMALAPMMLVFTRRSGN